jgi:hypothetical protein
MAPHPSLNLMDRLPASMTIFMLAAKGTMSFV